mmetsp:Transcript_119299/g.345076  ORF Transcript_119299/g.345076 Transcript_119299/m.345076 type:complete len:222 (-) Transcript_119299:269-934(-)
MAAATEPNVSAAIARTTNVLSDNPCVAKTSMLSMATPSSEPRSATAALPRDVTAAWRMLSALSCNASSMMAMHSETISTASGRVRKANMLTAFNTAILTEIWESSMPSSIVEMQCTARSVDTGATRTATSPRSSTARTRRPMSTSPTARESPSTYLPASTVSFSAMAIACSANAVVALRRIATRSCPNPERNNASKAASRLSGHMPTSSSTLAMSPMLTRC